MSSPPRVAILGAGVSGLAAAQVLTRTGFACTVYEQRPALGGVWSIAYPGVRLQNTYREYHFSSFPWPSPPDLHPTGEQIRAYLQAAVQALGIDVRLGHTLVAARPAGEGWELRFRVGERQHVEHVERLLVCSGQYTEGKNRPRFPGEEDFRGEILTEREMGDPARFDRRRVVVVGFGKSAVDMASFAAPRAEAVHHVFLTARWLLPQHLLGIHLTRMLFSRFGSVLMPSWTHPTAAERALHRYGGALVRGFWSGLRAALRAKARRAARGHGAEGRARLEQVIPRHGLVPDLRSAAAIAPASYYADVAAGRIAPHETEIAGFVPNGVRLSRGEVLEADTVVLSVGSLSPSFPFLPDEQRSLLEGEPDGPQLYRHLVHPRIPGLGFVGLNHSFLHLPCAEIGALWLAALWRGELTLPPVEEMERVVEEIRTWKRMNIAFEPSAGCAVSTRYQQYLDVLMLDLGLSPYRKLPNVLAEVFARYGADDYRGAVEEHLRAVAARRAPLRPLPLST